MIRFVACLAFLLTLLIYATPSVIAVFRNHKRWPLVVAIDIVLGWTIVGWMLAIAMSLDLRLRRPARPRRPRVRRPPVIVPEPVQRAEDPVRILVEPPEVRDEAYTRWLDGGAAMNA